MVPLIETARLRLRPLRPDDLDSHARMLADPGFVRFLGGSAHSREDSWRRMLMMSGLWAMLGYGYWSVEAKTDGSHLGVVGFADFKRDIAPSIEGLPEMGWLMAPSAQGQGVATEAVLGALAWADGALAGIEIVAIVDHRNAASVRVAEKAGFAVREEAAYRGEPILLFRRPGRGDLSPIS